MNIQNRGFWPLSFISFIHCVVVVAVFAIAARLMDSFGQGPSEILLNTSAIGAIAGLLMMSLSMTVASVSVSCCLFLAAFSGREDNTLALIIFSFCFAILGILLAREYGEEWLVYKYSVYIPIALQSCVILLGGLYISGIPIW